MAEYKIKDLENLTGIKAHTIRIWEKRYEIISPARTDTQIRTYSEADVKQILNIALLNKSGFKISKIAEMSEGDFKQNIQKIYLSKQTDVYFEKLLSALLNLDEKLFVQTLDNLIEMESVEETFSKYLTLFLDRVGVLWLLGTIHPGQEHFMSNLIRQKLYSVLDKMPVPENKEESSVLLFLPEDEWHEISLLYYHYFFRKNGIYSFYLGQSTPFDSVQQCIQKFKPKAIVSSLIAGISEEKVKDWFWELKKNYPELKIFVGGLQALEHKDVLKGKVNLIQSNQDLEKVLKVL